MDAINTLLNELRSFFGVDGLLEIFNNGQYGKLLTVDGLFAALGPVIPFILLLEIGRAVFYKRFKVEDYKIPFFIFVFNRFVSRFISIAAVAFCIGLFESHALIQTSPRWYWFFYGYLAWELAHFVYHFLAHKVRLFWCLHSTHHAPQQMNLFVTYAHFFLEAPYADVIRTGICILLGVNPPLLFLIMFIDGFWGSFIHVGENVLKDGRLGFLQHLILTPSHHRVHHAKNPKYIDTNYCNLLNIWDRLFKTYRDEDRNEPPVYGITREIKAGSFWDIYFGEVALLAKDIAGAPGIKNKLLYLIMAPGWSHTGQHKTAKAVKNEEATQRVVIVSTAMGKKENFANSNLDHQAPQTSE